MSENKNATGKSGTVKPNTNANGKALIQKKLLGKHLQQKELSMHLKMKLQRKEKMLSKALF